MSLCSNRWQVENSWGEDYGKDGYFTMYDNWFDDFVFEIVVPPDCLSDEAKKAMKNDPIPLPFDDPMCSLGRRSRRRNRK